MKKAKVLLAAIFILAIVGGVLAVKGNRFGSVIFINDPQNRCILPFFNYAITTVGGIIVPASPIPIQAPCPVARIIAQP